MFENWEELENNCLKCTKCKLCETRTNLVFGYGNKNSEIMFVGGCRLLDAPASFWTLC